MKTFYRYLAGWL